MFNEVKRGRAPVSPAERGLFSTEEGPLYVLGTGLGLGDFFRPVLRMERSLTYQIDMRRACLSQFFLKSLDPPKNLLYVFPSSLASYLTAANSIVQK